MSINIKPKNRGKFTSWCKANGYDKVTTACIEEALKSKKAGVRKKANFAKNARKFKH